MYFRDLKAYTYEQRSELETVLNVGWLDKDHIFVTGEVEDTIIDKIEMMIVTYKTTNQMRGNHVCNLCTPIDPYEDTFYWPPTGKRVLLGSSELWILGKSNKVYAAPDMIFHYITEHNYLPPSEFLNAVANFDLGGNWNADEHMKSLVAAKRK